MRFRSLISSVACLLGPISAQAAAQTSDIADCWRGEEIAAAHIQNLQSHLMVQALKCQDTLPSATESYNRFIEAKRPLMITNRRVIVAHFTRRYGPAEGQAAVTDYDTRLSNRSSTPAIDVAQCEKAAAFARMAATAADIDLPMLADTITANQLIADCEAPPATRVAMVTPAWPKAIPMRSAPPAAQAEPEAAAPPPAGEEDPSFDPRPLRDADMAPPAAREPVRTAAADDPVALPAKVAPTGGDQAEAVAALRAAVAALDRVAGTLQAGSPAPRGEPQ